MDDLHSIGMEKGLLYETIISTENEAGEPNAAPIGVICKDKREIVLYLNHATHTLENIKINKNFTVNITHNPLIFVNSTISDLDFNYFKKYNDKFYIKEAEAFFTATVESVKEVEKEDNIGKTTVNIIKANVNDIIIKEKQFTPLNRAIFAIIESLVYVSRIELVDDNTRNIYLERINEMTRVVNRVGGLDHKEAMKRILKYLEDK
mgnify:CR=1 FL=1